LKSILVLISIDLVDFELELLELLLTHI